MRFLISTNAGKADQPRAIQSESAAGRSGEARAKVEGSRPFPQTAPLRFSAHKPSVVDGPFPETKQ
jgi:hypothetical protein